MNYLAHLYFSDLTPDSCVGQLLPDCMPPRQLPDDVSAQLQRHVMLHQHIDHYTDNHPIVMSLRRQFEPPYRRFAGVLIDVFFDHYLARHWTHFHPQRLPDFAHQVYVALDAYEGPENPRLNQLRTALITHQWLPGYATREGMDRALRNLDRRSRFNTPLATGVELLDTMEEPLRNAFLSFFPELRDSVAKRRHQPGDADR